MKSLLLLLLLAGCATSLPKIEEAKLPAAPAAYKENWAIAAPAEAQPRGEWWKAFNDPVLDALVARAERANPTIQVAAARLQQARAVARITDADRSPQLGVGAGARVVGVTSTVTPSSASRTAARYSYIARCPAT